TRKAYPGSKSIIQIIAIFRHKKYLIVFRVFKIFEKRELQRAILVRKSFQGFKVITWVVFRNFPVIINSQFVKISLFKIKSTVCFNIFKPFFKNDLVVF